MCICVSGLLQVLADIDNTFECLRPGSVAGQARIFVSSGPGFGFANPGVGGSRPARHFLPFPVTMVSFLWKESSAEVTYWQELAPAVPVRQRRKRGGCRAISGVSMHAQKEYSRIPLTIAARGSPTQWIPACRGFGACFPRMWAVESGLSQLLVPYLPRSEVADLGECVSLFMVSHLESRLAPACLMPASNLVQFC